MTEHSFWSLLHFAEEILLLGLPSPAFSFVICSWSSENYISIIVYLSSDHYASSDKAQGPTYILGPLIPTICILSGALSSSYYFCLLFFLHLSLTLYFLYCFVFFLGLYINNFVRLHGRH